MPTGSERVILSACDEVAEHGHGFVLDSDVARKTGMGLRAVQDCLRGLDREGYVDLAPLDNGDLRASITPRGRQELGKDVGIARTSVPAPDLKSPLKIVPKGLRSFDAEDKDFFLELLPGPRRGDGLPESVHFWKVRIEEMDPDKTFRVGYVFGPSGCGKSSLVKAGLLPRLSKPIKSIYIEATGEETEARLLRGLRKQYPDLPTDLDLRTALVAARERIREGSNKILLVIDQFEQWYHARGAEPGTELAKALSECDGGRVQTIILVRDDYSMALHRFMAAIGVRQNQDQNFAVVDLFDLQHARKVLIAFGRGYGKLPDDPEEMTGAQNEFLDRTIKGLSQEGRVISVRLALFAEMLKGKPWTPGTLKQVGGAQGVGVTFLEETFSARTAPPSYRIHQKAVQAVLRALLPETGSSIKGNMRSFDELLVVSGYGSRPNEFDELVRILNSELRLISPTEPEGSESDGQTKMQVGEKFFLLTHDYLVPSIREWLTRKQKRTRRGRAELRLAERSSLWNSKPENRHLPSALEWANIRLLTRKKDWNEPQRRMMKRAGRVHGLRALGAATLIALLTWGGIEGYGTLRASSLVDSLRTASTTEVPAIVRQLTGYRRWANPRLKSLARGAEEASREKLHASLALLPVDPSQLPYLEKRLLDASPAELPVLRDALKPHQATLVLKLWSVLDSAKPGDVSLLPAASALAGYDPASPRWKSVGGKVAQTLVNVNPFFFGPWLEALRPVRTKLTAPLASILRDKQRPEAELALATNILTDYASDQPDILADVLMDADPKTNAAFFPVAQRQEGKIQPLFLAEIARKPSSSETGKDNLAERQARAAIALLRMGTKEEVLPLLRHSDDPRLRSFIINWLNLLGADPHVLAAVLEHIDPRIKPPYAEPPTAMDAFLFHPEISQRRALILALGTYGTEGFSASERAPLTAKLLDLYRSDPDSGIHGAAAWTLRQWGQKDQLQAADAELMKLKDRGDRRWFVNSQGQTFAVIEGPVEFRMGSPPTEPDRRSDETPRRVVIPRRFAIASQEVTVEQYQLFLTKKPEIARLAIDNYSPEPDGPMNGLTWYEAAAYCNWLSEQEGLTREKWCYLPNQSGAYDNGMTIPADVLQRTGYRLPTEAEWEYGCRSGTITGHYYGVSTDLLGKYAWYEANSRDHAWSGGTLLPNELGLFDMLGNVFEWVQDRYGRPTQTNDYINEQDILNIRNTRVIRGGTFDSPPALVRSTFRGGLAPSDRNSNGGFRPSRTYP